MPKKSKTKSHKPFEIDDSFSEVAVTDSELLKETNNRFSYINNDVNNTIKSKFSLLKQNIDELARTELNEEIFNLKNELLNEYNNKIECEKTKLKHKQLNIMSQLYIQLENLSTDLLRYKESKENILIDYEKEHNIVMQYQNNILALHSNVRGIIILNNDDMKLHGFIRHSPESVTFINPDNSDITKFRIDGIYDLRTYNKGLYRSFSDYINFINQGYNLSIIHHGISNSGKYDLFYNNDDNNHCTYHYVVSKLFEVFGENIDISFFSVYNNHLYDLSVPQTTVKKVDKSKRINKEKKAEQLSLELGQLNFIHVQSKDEVDDLFNFAISNRDSFIENVSDQENTHLFLLFKLQPTKNTKPLTRYLTLAVLGGCEDHFLTKDVNSGGIYMDSSHTLLKEGLSKIAVGLTASIIKGNILSLILRHFMKSPTKVLLLSHIINNDIKYRDSLKTMEFVNKCTNRDVNARMNRATGGRFSLTGRKDLGIKQKGRFSYAGRKC